MKKIFEIICLLLGGFGLGWICGLSVSPVTQIILTAITSILMAIVAISMGFHPGNIVLIKHLKGQSVQPIVIVIVGISIGATFGIYARTNSLFGEDPKRMIKLLENSGISHDSAVKYVGNYELELLKHKSLIDNTKPLPALALQNYNSAIPAVLYADTTGICGLIALKHGKQLKAILEDQNNKTINELLDLCSDSTCLEKIKIILCNQLSN